VRADAALADRRSSIRAAAKGWQGAGAIDETTYRAVVSAYPDDRVRLSLGLRILAGIAALVGGAAVAVLLGLVFQPNAWITVFLLGLAAAFTAATEIQVGRLRRAQAGAEYASALLAATAAGVSWVSLVDIDSRFVAGAGFALVFALAAWRWGFALLAGVASACLLLALSGERIGRGAFLLLGIAALPVVLRSSRSPRWPPAHRRCVAVAGLVLLAGAYLATNAYAVDHRWIDWLRTTDSTTPGAWSRLAATAGTILLPPLILAVGARRRDRTLLAAGTLFAAASLLTLRHYHPIGPWWLVLIVGGTSCLALAVVLRRWLDAGPGREQFGFTAEPAFAARRLVGTAEVAVTLAAMAPGPATVPEAPFEGGGGRSGGGGATGGT